jgi:hypothetical protein
MSAYCYNGDFLSVAGQKRARAALDKLTDEEILLAGVLAQQERLFVVDLVSASDSDDMCLSD